MRCLVCDQPIQINTLKQLFAATPLLLCGYCESSLVPKQGSILFENNEWIRQVIEKLNRGDLILINLFKNNLKAALQKKKNIDSKIIILEHSDGLPYPWLEILVNEVLKVSNLKQIPSIEPLVISVVEQEHTFNQLSITTQK